MINRPIPRSMDPPGTSGASGKGHNNRQPRSTDLVPLVSQSSATVPGAPSGRSRLSGYTIMVGMVLLTVLIYTLASMFDLEDQFGSWKTKETSTELEKNQTSLRTAAPQATNSLSDLLEETTSGGGSSSSSENPNAGNPSESEIESSKSGDSGTTNDSGTDELVKNGDNDGNGNENDVNDSDNNSGDDNDSNKNDGDNNGNDSGSNGSGSTDSDNDNDSDSDNDNDNDSNNDNNNSNNNNNNNNNNNDNNNNDNNNDNDNDGNNGDGNDGNDASNNQNNDSDNNVNRDSSKYDTKSMVNAVLAARQSMIDQLKSDYGDENFDNIFKKTTIPIEETEKTERMFPKKLRMEYAPYRPNIPKDQFFTPHWGEESDEYQNYQLGIDPKYYHSLENLQRKMMIKILGAQTGTNPNHKTYVWATGGHSAAAGHGNLFEETYTKVMEATATKVFESIGLKLEARNYAMGATSSAAEMAMCFREVYGDDVDVFSWDFGMLEARDHLTTRLLHYANRGLLSNQQGIVPAFVAVQEINSPRRYMISELQNAYRGGNGQYLDSATLENNGLALFLRDEDIWKRMKDAIPTTAGKSSEEIARMPPLVRYFKCSDDALEKGDPSCGDMKYSDEHCPNRQGKASWHPGWKHHAMVGNSMALFITDALVGAVQKIQETINRGDADGNDLETLLRVLEEEEKKYRDQMISATESQLPKDYDRIYWLDNISEDREKFLEEERAALEEGSDSFKSKWMDFDREAIFRGPSLCHTARIPSHTRFMGHLTNQHDLTGEQVVFGNETYFVGIEDKVYEQQNKEHPLKDEPEPHDMQLVWKVYDERDECGDVLVMPDYHDFFMADESEGFVNVVFPNEAEQNAYGYHQHKDKYKGILIMVPRFCGFGQCEKGFLTWEDYNNEDENKWEIKVNGKDVTHLTYIGHEAILMEHDGGIVFEPDQNDGRFHIEIKVNEPEHFVKISAFVLY